MNAAAAAHGSVVFVVGHDNPDTDTVVSAMAEAWRQHLLHGDRSTFVPVVPGHRVPDEAEELIGVENADRLVRTGDSDYRAAARAGRPEWIMVDHSIGREQPDTRAIIDHHYPSEIALLQQIPRRIVFAGSTCGLVAQKYYGMGLPIPPKLASYLHGTSLMDTENRLPGKMTALDELIMNRLQNASGQSDERAFYQRLMRKLITTYDADSLFQRDYKEDWSFGFAVAKGIHLLGPAHGEVVGQLLALARRSNDARNLPLTLVKVVDYADDAVTIARERLFPVYHGAPSPELERAVKDAIVTVIRHESPPGVTIEDVGGAIEYSGVGTQLSRKKLTPVLDPVVKAFNRYFYSPSTGLHFLRDWLRESPELSSAANRLGRRLHADQDGVLVGNPGALKLFLQETGQLAASPREYFRAWADATAVRDDRMVAHLTSSHYLETLDALVEDRSTLVEHPTMRMKDGALVYDGGERRKVTVPVGEPGLFDPKAIDPDTGLPSRVEDPRQYGKGLWRYWSPCSDRAWVLRSTIFAYDIPSLDLKFEYSEALPRLAIRPCVKTVRPPTVEIQKHAKKIRVDIRY
ncbi:MAG: DHH family phosphoesterase [Acidobacteriota bacterium]